MARQYSKILFFILFSFCSVATFALTLPNPESSDVVGKMDVITVPKGYDITKLAKKYDVGYLEFLEANPGINLQKIWAGSQLRLPTRYILPTVPRTGIVINLAELRLYYFPKNKDVFYTFPIGIGRSHTPTPLVKTRIISKRKDPIWIPTEDTHKEARELGIMLPRKIFPGPQNPLGKYAIRLGLRTYLIHGTNRPSGVGTRSSGGCIRMFNRDVKKLYEMVEIGTPVNIVDQAVKIGWRNNVLYLEVHVPVDLKRGKTDETLRPIMDELKYEVVKWNARIDWRRAILVAEQQTGIPTPIGRRSPDAKPNLNDLDNIATSNEAITPEG